MVSTKYHRDLSYAMYTVHKKIVNVGNHDNPPTNHNVYFHYEISIIDNRWGMGVTRITSN